MHLTLTSLVCFTSVYQLKRIICSREKCSGGKNSKVRLTDMAAASATGEKLPTLVVSKSKTPRCFKNIKQLPCRYIIQKKSWMTGDLFGECIRNLGSSFPSSKWKSCTLDR